MHPTAALTALFVVLATTAHAQRPQHYDVQSPDGATMVSVDVNGGVTYRVGHRGRIQAGSG